MPATASAPRLVDSSLARYEARYTEGDCWVLALELAERLGWSVAVTDGEDHAFALSPDGRTAVDVYGFQPLKELLARWHAKGHRRFGTVAEARDYFHGDSASAWGTWGGSTRVQWRLAGRVAEQVLALT